MPEIFFNKIIPGWHFITNKCLLWCSLITNHWSAGDQRFCFNAKEADFYRASKMSTEQQQQKRNKEEGQLFGVVLSCYECILYSPLYAHMCVLFPVLAFPWEINSSLLPSPINSLLLQPNVFNWESWHTHTHRRVHILPCNAHTWRSGHTCLEHKNR